MKAEVTLFLNNITTQQLTVDLVIFMTLNFHEFAQKAFLRLLIFTNS